MISPPKGWKRITIGSVCELINGRAFKPSDWATAGLPIVRIQNLNDPDAKFNYFEGSNVRSRFLIDSGALLFAWSGTPGTSFGAHIWNGGPAILNQHIFNVVFDQDKIDKEFFRLAINQKLDELIDKAHGGVGLRHVTKGKFEDTEIDLPPIWDQRVIVAKLEGLRSRSKTALGELNHISNLVMRYKQAVLQTAFNGSLTEEWRNSKSNLPPIDVRASERGGAGSKKMLVRAESNFVPPFPIPPTWVWARLPQLGVLDRGRSRHRPRNHPSLYGGPYPFIQTGDVKAANGWLTSYSQTYSEAGLAQSRLWPKGTVCITIAANIADTAILAIDACFPDSVVGFLANSSLCDSMLIEYFIRTIQADLAAFAPATAQKNINLETLRTVYVPCAPLIEQTEIVRRVKLAFEHVDQIVAETDRARKLIDRLDQSILLRAFRGDLIARRLSQPTSEVLAAE